MSIEVQPDLMWLSDYLQPFGTGYCVAAISLLHGVSPVYRKYAPGIARFSSVEDISRRQKFGYFASSYTFVAGLPRIPLVMAVIACALAPLAELRFFFLAPSVGLAFLMSEFGFRQKVKTTFRKEMLTFDGATLAAGLLFALQSN